MGLESKKFQPFGTIPNYTNPLYIEELCVHFYMASKVSCSFKESNKIIGKLYQ